MNIFKIRESKDIRLLLINILIAEFMGWVSILFLNIDIKSFFEILNKPIFHPSYHSIAIMWTIICFFIGIAAYRIMFLNKRGLNVKKILILYFVQLALNLIWIMTFFRFKLLWITFLESLVMFIIIMITTLEFKRFDKISFYLMIPYVIWVAFFIILSYCIWGLN